LFVKGFFFIDKRHAEVFLNDVQYTVDVSIDIRMNIHKVQVYHYTHISAVNHTLYYHLIIFNSLILYLI